MVGDKNNVVEIVLEKKHIANSPIQIISEATDKIDFCFDNNLLSSLKEDNNFVDTVNKLKRKGVYLRLVTEVDPDNLQFCNKITKGNGNVFHKSGVTGNFAILDGKKFMYFLPKKDVQISLEESPNKWPLGDAINQFIFIKTKSFVNLQQYLFDNLCSNSVAAEEKIREIKRGTEENFNEIISDTDDILNTTTYMINSATQEILLLIPNENTFYLLEYGGMLNLLWKAASERNVIIKILIHINQIANDQNTEKENAIKESIQKVVRKGQLPIEVQYLPKPLENNLITIIMDQVKSLAIEVSSDSQTFFEKAIKSAVYSNSEITVSSCLSIFDTLWIQSELDKQNKIKQAYFQMFKGFNLKDEIYTRKWQYNRNKK